MGHHALPRPGNEAAAGSGEVAASRRLWLLSPIPLS